MRRILILTADMGFGHRSAANAIAAALKELHPADCDVQIVNPMLDKGFPAFIRRGSEDYDWVVRELPRLYKLAYDVAETGGTRAVLHNAFTVVLFQVIRDLIQRDPPDAIVTPYPFYQAPLAAAFALTKRRIPLLTVVTDLAPVHRTWFHKAADLCLVPVPAVRQQAIECGLPPERVKVTGLPVHPNLAHGERNREAARAGLGWPRHLTTVLAVGSKRVRNMPGILNALNHSGLPLQLAVVAGGDDALFRQLKDVEWHVPTHLYNFVDDMPTLMHAADCIICKAGGLIVNEALACGLPLLLTNVIEGQETSNARYVIEGGAGDLVGSPLEGLEVVFHWLDKGGRLLAQRGRNARRLGRPRAAYAVARLAWMAAVRGPQPGAERLHAKVGRMMKRVLTSKHANVKKAQPAVRKSARWR